MQKFLSFCVLYFALCSAADSKQNLLSADQYNFDDFIRQFNRNYSSLQQYNQRKLVFQQNYQRILQQQQKANGTYHVTINNFTDWTQNELDAYFSYKPLTYNKLFSEKPQRLTLALSYPSSLDYRAMGKVTDVKDQGQCGDCWAFSTTALYESLLLIEGSSSYDLAQQYVLDCTSGSSCNGGYPKDALDMLVKTGIPLQSAYAYKQRYRYYGSGICSASNRVKLNSTVNSVNHYNSMTDTELKQALTDHGPLPIGIYASSSFSSYSSGIYTGCPSNSASYINHAVLLVGYTSNGDWIIKNSWGSDWGDQGYVTISKSYNCGLNTFVDVVTMTTPSPSPSPSPSPQPSPSPSPSPSPQPSPSPNATYVNYTIYLMDTYSDGWGGLIIGIRQGSAITSTFGQGFTNGSSYGPVKALVKQNIFAQLVVVQFANYTQQISFDVYDQNNTLIYTRQCRLNKFQPSIIFIGWCPGSNCLSPNSTLVFVTMMDSWGDGWNGNSIAFKQNNNITATFGLQFKSGHALGPIQITLLYGVQADIIVNTLGSWRNEIGFIIRDKNGLQLFSRLPGQSYYANTIFGSICASCLNYADVRYSTIKTDPNKQIMQKYTGLINQSQTPSNNSTTVQAVQQTGSSSGLTTQVQLIIGMISFFTLFFMVATVVLFILWRNERVNKFFRLETQNNASINQSGMILATNQNAQSTRSNFGLNENKYKVPQSPLNQRTANQGLFILG